MVKIKENVSLKELTTFKIGGEARYFVEAQSKEELIEALKLAKDKNLPFFVLGGGSNLLVSDNGFEGIVVKFQVLSFRFQNGLLLAEAGTALEKLVVFSVEQGLAGLEWAAGIPRATLGGAVYMNAGAFGHTIADVVEYVEALDAETLQTKQIDFKDCQFDYKDSIFKKNKNLIILSCALCLEKKTKEEVQKQIDYVLDYRRKGHPIEFPSVGSIFKNPRYIPAGEVIEKCGLKGKQIGDAKISEKHCNFIVNLGQASANDVKQLINLVKKQVQEKFDIMLQEEVQYLGF